jgi:hypothetical protein
MWSRAYGAGVKLTALFAWLALATAVAHATPLAPTGAHPRMLLDDPLRAAWKAQAAGGKGPVVAAIAICDDAARPGSRYVDGVYQSENWNKALQACLVAWAATGSTEHEHTALHYLQVILDDLDHAGDGKGGDDAAIRDSGYAIRNMGAVTAFAYDWLYDKLQPAQREHARARWAAWLARWAEKGYRRHDPGSNYHAGYAMASTAIAVAEAGEAGAESDAQWKRVADELWGTEMAHALGSGGPLPGGDSFEGWQYAPLMMAQYSLAARLMRQAGVPIDGVAPWLHAVLERHVYALSPAGQVFAGGDVEPETPNVQVFPATLDAVALGDASPDDKRYARGELARLKIPPGEYPLYDALASVGEPPVYVPNTWPTWFVATATQTLYARTRWDERAVWFVAECAPEFDMDHRHSVAGNFVVSRGSDDVIVDPTLYGSLSTLSSNAPAIKSPHLPADLQPSQGPYGGARWRWAAQTATGVVAARCDYTERFKVHEDPGDIPEALRDLVLLPDKDGTSATVVVFDRATTGGAERTVDLRFRTPGRLAAGAAGADVATATVGGTRLAIAALERTSGTPHLEAPTAKNCDNVARGACEAARFAVTELQLKLDGGMVRAAHALSVSDAAGSAAAAAVKGDGWEGVRVAGTRDAIVVWPIEPGGARLSYVAPRATAVTHVVLDAPATDDRAAVTAHAAGDGCAVDVTGDNAATALPARPLVFTVDDKCAVAVDKASAIAPSAANTKAPRAARRSSRLGCCDGGSGASAVLGVLVLGFVGRARSRARR